MNHSLVEEIRKLKAERKAVILAHNYVLPEIQDIADFTGDSLELSIKAKEAGAEVILFCGVRFMAETAKLLSPDSIVLLPVPDAGCPMADMASAAEVKAAKLRSPETVFVAYVNSTADTKSWVDITCTSGNVEKILNTIPDGKKVMFLPDRNLGANMNQKMGRTMELWDGCCPIHNAITPEMIREAKQKHPGAEVLLHPECPPETVAEADYALSTSGILKRVRASHAKEFIIGTECGILHRLEKENPGKKFYLVEPAPVCENMKKITLASVRDALKEMKYVVELPAETAENAVKPIRKMLSV